MCKVKRKVNVKGKVKEVVTGWVALYYANGTRVSINSVANVWINCSH